MGLRIHQLLSPKEFTKIELPASKSISNRVLIIDFLQGAQSEISNLSLAKDTQILSSILKKRDSNWDVQDAGTAMRFLTALACLKEGKETIIQGTSRMHERPILELVEALRAMGAKIEYLGRTGFPPLKITGNSLHFKSIEMDGKISSQFISALLMIAPYVKGGLEIALKADQVSLSYINMTIEVMKHFGASIKQEKNRVIIKEKGYNVTRFCIESDWSSASYWCNLAILFPRCSIQMEGLLPDSIQGDSVLLDIYKELGLEYAFNTKGLIVVRKKQPSKSYFEFDLSSTPDLAQSIVAILALTKNEGRIKGIDHLKYKETDRLKSLTNELKKIGYLFQEESPNEFLVIKDQNNNLEKNRMKFEMYKDHRMAMSFALAATLGSIELNCDRNIVSKSYPTFFTELKKFGFEVVEI